MDRKEFVRKGIMGTGMFVASGVAAQFIKNDIDELASLDPIEDKIVGFNHIPNTKSNIMENIVLHKADS